MCVRFIRSAKIEHAILGGKEKKKCVLICGGGDGGGKEDASARELRHAPAAFGGRGLSSVFSAYGSSGALAIAVTTVTLNTVVSPRRGTLVRTRARVPCRPADGGGGGCGGVGGGGSVVRPGELRSPSSVGRKPKRRRYVVPCTLARPFVNGKQRSSTILDRSDYSSAGRLHGPQRACRANALY